jgi:two-component system, NarL family, capsular synthesis sensor histidine kinase RcsC
MNATQGSGLRILLVEDNEAILRSLGSLLRMIGHSVSEATNVREALSLFQCQVVDLLISDINLGSESGLELIRRIRQTSEMPAIAMSAQSELSETSLASGFSAFLDKPFSRQYLQQTIRQVSSGSPVAELGSETHASGSRLLDRSGN